MTTLPTISAQTLNAWKQEKPKDAPIIIDVRSKAECDAGIIAGSINIPLDILSKEQLPNVKENTRVVFHCRRGKRTQMAAETIVSLDLAHCYCLDGGIEAWQFQGYPLIQPEALS